MSLALTDMAIHCLCMSMAQSGIMHLYASQRLARARLSSQAMALIYPIWQSQSLRTTCQKHHYPLPVTQWLSFSTE